MERTLVGISASPGIVIGRARLLHWEVPEVPHRVIPDDGVEAEAERFHRALEQARERLHVVRHRAEHHAGPEEAAIFDMQLLLLDDAEMRGRVESLIRQNLSAEKAFGITMLEWREEFARHASPMMRERLGDITDIQIRVLSLLLGLPDHDPVDVPYGEKVILVTHDLTPSLTVQLDRDAIAGIATDAGTRTSHVAILARSLGIPAVVGLRDATSRLHGGEVVILDGAAGTLNVTPSGTEIDAYGERARLEEARSAALVELLGAESVTLDGERVVLRVNLDIPEESDLAVQSGAEGVGLMRTEFLVVGRASMPDEDEQYRVYRRVAESFPNHPVVIRTYDLGGDKLPVGGFPPEANPFLGWRAIRMCLDQPDLFKTQLRALLRAATHGDIRIMLPLIVSVDEVRGTRELLRIATEELTQEGVAHRADVPLGVMVETPAAAVWVHSLVDEVDFLSIGTNDLVQYTLAVDRGNANLATRFTPLHPSVLWLIQRTVDAGAARGAEVCVCGEMASQEVTAFALLGLGVRQMSVSPRSVLLVKRLIRSVRADVARAAAAEALRMPTAADAEAVFRERLGQTMDA